MTETVTQAAERLAAVLAAENAALDAMDMVRAGGFLSLKQEALEAVLRAQSDTPPPALATRLRALTEENKRLLERAIAVQSRIIGIVAAALPRSTEPPRYAAGGGIVKAARPVAHTLSARA